MDPARSSQLDEAVRVDEAAATIETAAFFGPEPDRLFGVLSRPAADTTRGAVICCPIQAEFEKNYRSEVLLGRELARRGVAAHRFHYRGTGHSDGDTAETTFDSMVEDAASAAERLRDEGVERICFMGTRWGALVAASAAARAGAPLAMWEPMLRADEHFRNAFRARSVRRLRVADGAPVEQPLDELKRTGVIDAVGYDLRLALYESAAGRTLDEELGEGGRRLLLLQLARQDELRGEYARAAEGWRARSFEVTTLALRGDEGWWFATNLDRWEPEASRTDPRALHVTARWVSEALA